MAVRACVLFALLFACVAAPAAQASPADPYARFDLSQPDGTAFTARPWGDEFEHGLETAGGYTLVVDDGWYEYAQQAPDGSLAPSGLRAGIDAPGTLPKYLRNTGRPAPDTPFGERGDLGRQFEEPLIE